MGYMRTRLVHTFIFVCVISQTVQVTGVLTQAGTHTKRFTPIPQTERKLLLLVAKSRSYLGAKVINRSMSSTLIIQMLSSSLN